MNDMPVKRMPDGDGGKAPFMRRRAPMQELAPYVDCIVGYSENGSVLRHAVEMAPLVVPLIVSFGEAFEIGLGRAPVAADSYASFTSGLYPGYVLINSTGRSACVQIDFTPLGAFRFFGFPMSEIACRMVTLDDLADPGIDAFRSRLAEINDWDARLDLAERFVAERISRGVPASVPVSRAHEAIVRRRGAVRIGDIARSLDWSRKHLVRRFREEIGIGPKSFARMVRFNHALAVGQARRGTGWADIAAECGYADQAHLVREFRAFSGASPTGLAPGA